MKTRSAIAGLVLWFLANSGQAFQPSGWVWFTWPYAYEADSGDWYWMNPADELWVYGALPGGRWRQLEGTVLASRWAFINWPYAYDYDTAKWFYIDENNSQWCLNMATGVWSVFGQAPATTTTSSSTSSSTSTTTTSSSSSTLATTTTSTSSSSTSSTTTTSTTSTTAEVFAMLYVPAGVNAGVDLDFGPYELSGRAFYMDETPVTKAEWDVVYAWALQNGYSFDHPGLGKGPDHPVHTVNWFDCAKWCNARSEMERLTPAYYTDNDLFEVFRTGQAAIEYDWVDWHQGYRLPTEAEWEYAARGGVASRRFPWDDTDTIDHTRANYHSTGAPDYDLSLTTGPHPLYNTGGEPFTNPVRDFPPNPYGFYDMAGNIGEWCADWFGDLQGSHRALRGGNWVSDASMSRVGNQGLESPHIAGPYVGFRTVLPEEQIVY